MPNDARHPALQILAQLVGSSYPEDIKGRTAVFAEEIAAHALSLEAAAQLSSDAHTYFQALVTMFLLVYRRFMADNQAFSQARPHSNCTEGVGVLTVTHVGDITSLPIGMNRVLSGAVDKPIVE